MFPALRFFNLPNGATTLSVVAGFCAVLSAARGQPRLALSFLLGAIVLDKLDGFLARRLGRTSDFGRELDSLADGVSFCVAPALIGIFAGAGLLVTACAIVYCVCGIWRLAYFNITGLAGEGSEERFTGVPTTVAASWFLIALSLLGRAPRALFRPSLVGLYLALGLLMASSLPFRKRGLLVKSLYLLLPAAMLLVWL